MFHGRSFPDPYFWLREKGTPDVEKYLEAENAYTEATSADVKPFSEALYQELLGRIKQTDLSVPTRIGGFYYYRRTVEGLQYPIRCRKPAAADGGYQESAPEQVLLDQNEMAKGKPFLSIGDFEVSDDAAQLLFTTDDTGFRQYKLFVKDIGTGAVQGPIAERVTSAAWAADNRTLFYVTEHPVTKRSDTLWRQALGGEPVKLHEEKDELYSIWVYRTKDRKLDVLGLRSTDTWEARLVDSATPEAPWRVVLPREKGHKYEVEHRNGTLFIRTNKDAKNFRLVTAPLADPSPADWKTLVEHRPDVLLQELDVFKDFLVVQEKRAALNQLRVHDFATGSWREVPFPEPVYAAFAAGTPEFESKLFRYSYQSLITPASVFDYDTRTGQSHAAEARGRARRLRPAALRLRASLGHRARRRQGPDQHRLQEGPRARRALAALALRVRLLRLRHAGELRQQAAEPARPRHRRSRSRTSAAATRWARPGTTTAC